MSSGMDQHQHVKVSEPNFIRCVFNLYIIILQQCGYIRIYLCVIYITVFNPWYIYSHPCAAVMCPDLPNPTNGRIVYGSDSEALFDVSTIATYMCDEGYGPATPSSITRTCLVSATDTTTNPIGDWFGSAPTCEG